MADSQIISPPFLARIEPRPAPPSGDEPEETVAPGNAFAVVRGLRSPITLRFLHADGSLIHALPYGYLPVIWGHSPGVTVIEYPNLFALMLAGENIAPLEARLCEYRVTWIRLTPPRLAATEQEGAAQATPPATTVHRIERLTTLPSREPPGRLAG